MKAMLLFLIVFITVVTIPLNKSNIELLLELIPSLNDVINAHPAWYTISEPISILP